MKLQAVLTASLIYSGSALAISFNEAQAIYNKLIRVNGIRTAPTLVYVNSGLVGCRIEGRYISIYKGMLQYIRNNHEAAIILGHELAHLTVSRNQSRQQEEYAADRKGAQYAARAGYSVCIGAQALRGFHDRASSTHPSSENRYKRLGC